MSLHMYSLVFTIMSHSVTSTNKHNQHVQHVILFHSSKLFELFYDYLNIAGCWLKIDLFCHGPCDDGRDPLRSVCEPSFAALADGQPMTASTACDPYGRCAGRSRRRLRDIGTDVKNQRVAQRERTHDKR